MCIAQPLLSIARYHNRPCTKVMVCTCIFAIVVVRHVHNNQSMRGLQLSRRRHATRNSSPPGNCKTQLCTLHGEEYFVQCIKKHVDSLRCLCQEGISSKSGQTLEFRVGAIRSSPLQYLGTK